jgi:hypothetical protein
MQNIKCNKSNKFFPSLQYPPPFIQPKIKRKRKKEDNSTHHKDRGRGHIIKEYYYFANGTCRGNGQEGRGRIRIIFSSLIIMLQFCFFPSFGVLGFGAAPLKKLKIIRH